MESAGSARADLTSCDSGNVLPKLLMQATNVDWAALVSWRRS